MRKIRHFAIATTMTLFMSGSLEPSFAASAHNSQAGAYGPSNVNAPIPSFRGPHK